MVPAGGKVFVVYGSSSRAALPADAVELGTRSFTGAGFFLVDEGTGRATVFKDAPGEDEPKFLLENGDERWYTFTTLGDGMPGNAIRIIPGAIDGFLAPLDPDLSSTTVDTVASLGNVLVSRDSLDSASGSLFVGPALTEHGRLTAWSVFGGDFDDDPSDVDDRYVTPVIFRQNDDGGFAITGIGEGARIVANEPQSFEFVLAAGSDAVAPGHFLGWYDGAAGRGDNRGAVPFNTFAFPGDSSSSGASSHLPGTSRGVSHSSSFE